MLAYFSLSAASTNSLPTINHSWIIGCSLAAIYFAPALVAFFRRQQNRRFILALNFLFGWTIVGWSSAWRGRHAHRRESQWSWCEPSPKSRLSRFVFFGEDLPTLSLSLVLLLRQVFRTGPTKFFPTRAHPPSKLPLFGSRFRGSRYSCW